MRQRDDEVLLSLKYHRRLRINEFKTVLAAFSPLFVVIALMFLADIEYSIWFVIPTVAILTVLIWAWWDN